MIKTSVGTPILDKFDEFAKFVKNSTLGGVFKSFDTKVLAPIKNFFTLGKGGGAFVLLYHYLMTLKLHYKEHLNL